MDKFLASLAILLGSSLLIRAECRMIYGLLKEPGGWCIVGIYAVAGITCIIVGLIGFYINRQHYRQSF